jgi:hypothetical protein
MLRRSVCVTRYRGSSEKSLVIHETTRRHVPDRNFDTRRRENLKI